MPLTPARRQHMANVNRDLAQKTLRVLAVVYLPFLQPVFDTVPLGLREWAVVGH